MNFQLFKRDDAGEDYATAIGARGEVVVMTKDEAAEPGALERAERRLRAFRSALKAHPRLGTAVKDDDREGDEPDDDEMCDDEKRRRGVAATKGEHTMKPIFKNIIFGDMAATREYPIEDQPSRQPRGVDRGEDALGRTYGDEVYGRLGGLNLDQPDTSPIPRAGAGETWEGDTRRIVYRPQAFMGARDDAYVGGEERTYSPIGPNRGNGEAYELLRENLPGAIPVRLGDGWVMNPQASGIADAAPFRAPEPAVSVRKATGTGVFTDVVLAPLDTTNFFNGR